MNLNELRQILHDFQDTPANRNELCEELVATNASDLVWGYAEQYIPGLEEWWDQQLKIPLRLDLRSDMEAHLMPRLYLDGAWLANVEIDDMDLRRASLRGADLSGAKLVDTYFRFADFSGANLQRANLHRSFLTDANLSNADLQNADLSRTNFNRSNLQNANLRGVNLSNISWYIDTNFTGALYDDETVFPEGFDPESRGMVFDDESQ